MLEDIIISYINAKFVKDVNVKDLLTKTNKAKSNIDQIDELIDQDFSALVNKVNISFNINLYSGFIFCKMLFLFLY